MDQLGWIQGNSITAAENQSGSDVEQNPLMPEYNLAAQTLMKLFVKMLKFSTKTINSKKKMF